MSITYLRESTPGKDVFENNSTNEFAAIGIDFTTNPIHALTVPEPKAPGCFRPDLTEPAAFGWGIAWGICMKEPSGPSSYLLRYEIDLTLSE